MQTKILSKGHNVHRLRWLIALLFLALVTPTSVLIWQANSQLKWEAFHQYRGLAEELVQRIDRSLIAGISVSESRSFADFSFLNVTGDPSANFLQRSPLSTYPIVEDVPGVIGYFQVDPNGVLSTPMLPPSGTDSGKFGISADEYDQRLAHTSALRQILADNRLVRDRPGADDKADREEVLGISSQAVSAPEIEEEGGLAVAGLSIKDELTELKAADNDLSGTAQQQSPTDYSQQVFDHLNQPDRRAVPAENGLQAGDEEAGAAARGHAKLFPKVQDLKLDEALQKKSATLDRRTETAAEQQQRTLKGSDSAARMRRKEQAALPETVSSAAQEERDDGIGGTALRISTFESEIDPYEFSLLDSGHLVLFRMVWREGERYIQGLLIDQKPFFNTVIDSAFRATTVSTMSNLFIGYQDNVIDVFRGGESAAYPGAANEMEGDLLYRSRLSAPLDSIELIFSINRLPPGPGATTLLWTTVIIAIVFLGGFYALYWLGLSQIKLARQQQDFVSAVSHELKTPLTSIRMYGEMLKEGWVDEEKRNQYYQYIQDESERLTRLISNVLRLAKITRNEAKLDSNQISVGELMNRLESRITSQVQHAGFKLTFTRGELADQAIIYVDEDCFAQIVINLVDNAIKFSKNAENQSIDIGSSLNRDNQVNFTVRDYGPGIPQNQLKKIFQLFYRPESELTRETVGTGIGLAIVHQLTSAMKGKIDVVNRRPGTEFSVLLPTITVETGTSVPEHISPREV